MYFPGTATTSIRLSPYFLSSPYRHWVHPFGCSGLWCMLGVDSFHGGCCGIEDGFLNFFWELLGKLSEFWMPCLLWDCGASYCLPGGWLCALESCSSDLDLETENPRALGS